MVNSEECDAVSEEHTASIFRNEEVCTSCRSVHTEGLLPGCTKCLSPTSFCEILFRDVSPCGSACLLKAFSPLVLQLASQGTHVQGAHKASATFGPLAGANNELQHRSVTVPGTGVPTDRKTPHHSSKSKSTSLGNLAKRRRQQIMLLSTMFCMGAEPTLSHSGKKETN
jgi:hypothetical protein